MPITAKTFRYEADLRWEGERRALVRAEGRPAIHVSPPLDLGGAGDGDWTPEHLFLAALSSCTLLSFLAHAARRDVAVVSYASTVEGTVARREQDGRFAFTAALLRPSVVVAAGQRAAAEALTGKAERDCFVAASTTAEVETRWDIREQ
jgi:organic hydroperoxide reductase OsmC/OhrA